MAKFDLDALNVPENSPAEHHFQQSERRRKAQQLKAIASLGCNTDRMHLLAHQMRQAGLENESNGLHDAANRIAEAFDRLIIPTLD